MNQSIINVSASEFQTLVIDSSFKQPVLIDFWADWCEPCKTMTPLLEKLAKEYGGGFILAKVDTDKEQELAMHIGIKSLPTLKLIVDGQVADERTGAISEGELRAFLNQFISSESDKLMAAATDALNQGRTEEALDLMNQALAKDPSNVELKIKIATISLDMGNQEGAITLLDSLDSEGRKNEQAIKLRTQIEISGQLENIPELDQIDQQLATNPNDLQALLDKSTRLSATGDYEAALECAMRIVEKDNAFQNGAGQAKLLSLFDLLGGNHPSVQKYRRKLFTLLH